MNSEFQSILIYGLGLMGGSLSLALRKLGFRGKISGVVRSQKTYDELVNLNITDEIYLEDRFLGESLWNHHDLIIFSLPVDLTCDKILLVPDSYNGVLTDLGSTKKEILKTVRTKYPFTHNYYSSHPMAGSENSGALYSNPDLYSGKLCILTADSNTSSDAVRKITQFWKLIGCTTIEIPAEEHDDILAYLSHSPHILSSLLVTWAESSTLIQKHTNSSPVPLSGGGFRDMSRIAGSNPEMWEAIINTNRKSILESLKKFQSDLGVLIAELEGKNGKQGFWKEYFESSKKARDRLLKLNSVTGLTTER